MSFTWLPTCVGTVRWKKKIKKNISLDCKPLGRKGRETCPIVLFLINKERALGSFMPSCFSYLLDVANDGTNGKSRPEADGEVTKQREHFIHAQTKKIREKWKTSPMVHMHLHPSGTQQLMMMMIVIIIASICREPLRDDRAHVVWEATPTEEISFNPFLLFLSSERNVPRNPDIIVGVDDKGAGVITINAVTCILVDLWGPSDKLLAHLFPPLFIPS